jgi:hypothetical protein
MATSEIVYGTLEHAKILTKNIRPADAREIFAAAARRSAYECIVSLNKLGGDMFTGLIDGEVACMLGVYRPTHTSTKGIPWMLTTKLIDRHPKLFLKGCRDGMEIIKATWDYSHLENYVDAEYDQAIRWLKWLGFTIHPAAPYGPFGLPFHRFEMRIK